MKILKNITKHFCFFIIMSMLLFSVNIVIIFITAYCTNNNMSYIPVKTISSYVTYDGGYSITSEGIKMLNDYNSFAMIIDNTGKVQWRYNVPEEIPDTYSISDIASFSRYYLKDYPVFSYIRDDGILVVGAPKYTIWKYQIIFYTDTITAYFRLLFPLLFIDIFLLIIIPIITTRRHNRLRERERTTWIAGVSHDIRTPLSLIMVYADELRTAPMTKELAEKAEIIHEQSIRIKNLINNLNTENKLEYGFHTINVEIFSLTALLREILCDFINCETKCLHEFNLDIADGINTACIKGDKELIRRMIENLLNNSVRHNPDGCRIDVRLMTHRRFYLLTISDDGKGLTKEQLKIFNSATDGANLPEHGLGLRLVKQIAKAHKWKVQFDRNERCGMKCTIIIKK